jgi:hypothetical protein
VAFAKNDNLSCSFFTGHRNVGGIRTARCAVSCAVPTRSLTPPLVAPAEKRRSEYCSRSRSPFVPKTFLYLLSDIRTCVFTRYPVRWISCSSRNSSVVARHGHARYKCFRPNRFFFLFCGTKGACNIVSRAPRRFDYDRTAITML